MGKKITWVTRVQNIKKIVVLNSLECVRDKQRLWLAELSISKQIFILDSINSYGDFMRIFRGILLYT